jgi:putative flippase GtrA
MSQIFKIFKKYQSLIKYLITGVSAFAVDYVTLTVFYYFVSVNLSLATTLGFVAGFIVSFISNRNWVFGANGSERKASKQLVKYSILIVFNYLFTVVSLNMLKGIGVEPFIGKIMIMGLITIWNYLLFKCVIFAPKK